MHMVINILNFRFHLDAILSYIGIGFCGLEFILAIVAIVQFAREGTRFFELI